MRHKRVLSYTLSAFIFFSLVATAAIAQSPTIIYVRKGAAPNGTGNSWSTAYSELTQALAAATSISGQKEIWVAKGEYKPTTSLDRSASFVLPAQTRLYGGFLGNETTRTIRNWRNVRSVLSGDLGAMFDIDDNSYHVVKASNVDSATGLDGFIITGGNANVTSNSNDVGAGILVTSSSSLTSPFINQCEFVHNVSTTRGGALAIISDGASTSIQVSNTFFNGNSSNDGGAVALLQLSGSNTSSFINCSFSTNTAHQNGGAIYTSATQGEIVNCTFTKNNCISEGGAVYNSNGSSTSIRNSILWENFKGSTLSSAIYNQVVNNGSTPIIQNNIIQGGFGQSSDSNLDSDPKFVREPSFDGRNPRTSIIPVTSTPVNYENELSFNGEKLPGPWPYVAFKDHAYNKLYLIGSRLQIIDFNNVVDNKPTSTVHYDVWFGKMERLDRAIHTNSNKIYFATHFQGIMTVDRQTKQISFIDPVDEPHTSVTLIDLTVDDENELLYACVFTENGFYGLLELNLATDAKRWITKTSSPVKILGEMPSLVYGDYFGVYRMYLDKTDNVLYFSTGAGVWWWNRTDNTTGLITTTGGMPLRPGNPFLPSNATTAIYMDHKDNKLYIGTMNGLFVWNKNDNTSTVFNSENSVLTTNHINNMDKNDELNILYVACELGGFMEINTLSGEQKYYGVDQGSEVYPQMPDNNTASGMYDEVEKKLYVCFDSPLGGVWIKDYNNLIPDYGDLRLQVGSPAIDRGDSTALGTNFTLDINGAQRRVDYSSIFAANSLDLGAYEKDFVCQQPVVSIQYEKSKRSYSFTPLFNQMEEGCDLSYSWTFGDGSTSVESNPQHTYASSGVFLVRLKLEYQCSGCPASETIVEQQIQIEEDLCEAIYCHPDGSVSVGTPTNAGGFALAVKGKMIIEGARIVPEDAWPDYVFANGYKLRSLEALKEYIRLNGHLPNIPAASNVRDNGIDVGKMSTLLLEKTEELTLYMIQLEARLKKLEDLKSKKP
jgi:predicted outer membrane repeat protein